VSDLADEAIYVPDHKKDKEEPTDQINKPYIRATTKIKKILPASSGILFIYIILH
jgi:hypothetical protein